MRRGYARLIVGLVFVLLLISVSRCRETPSTPQPTPPPSRPLALQQAFFPFWAAPFLETSPKVALAWSDRPIRSWPKAALGGFTPDSRYHRWQCNPLLEPLAAGYGREVVMVWSDNMSNSGFDYPQCFADFVAAIFGEAESCNLTVLWANEWDRPDQANMTIAETARLFLDLVEICPNGAFIGPGTSTTDDGQQTARVLQSIKDQCGIPCPAIERIYALQPHMFTRPERGDCNPIVGDPIGGVPNPCVNVRPSERVDIFCDWVYGVRFDGLVTPCDPDVPIWPTIGWWTCHHYTTATVHDWIDDVVNDDRIELAFFFTTTQHASPECHFDSFLDESCLPAICLGWLGQAWYSYWRRQ